MKEQVTAGTSWRCPQNERWSAGAMSGYGPGRVKTQEFEARRERYSSVRFQI
jgi:hypothetical protein